MNKKLPQYVFYLGLTLELIIFLFERTNVSPLPAGQIFRITFVLFAFKICLTKYTRREWLALILFTVFTFVMYHITGQNIALRAVFFVAAMRDINIRMAMKYTFWLTFSGFLMIMALSFMGIGRDIKDTAIYRDVLETRYHFGFGHPNTFYCMVLTLLLLFLYCYQEKINLSVLTVLFVVNICLFLLTDSRTGFAVCTLTIILALLLNISPKLRQRSGIYYAGMVVFLVCIGFSVWIAYHADSVLLWIEGSWLDKLDVLLTRRVRNLYWQNTLYHASLKGWTLFSDANHFSRIFDMGWVRMFYWFGIIPGSIFTGLHLMLQNEIRKTKDYAAFLLVIIVAVYTVVEPQYISHYLGRNFLLFLFGAYWSQMLYVTRGTSEYWWRFFSGVKQN